MSTSNSSQPKRATAGTEAGARAPRKSHPAALFAAGGDALGNLTDRISRAPGAFQGHVVDFISVQHFAVFNLADSAIVCGGARRKSGIVVPG